MKNILKNRMKRWGIALLLLTMAALSAAGAEERWYSVYIGDQKVGYIVQSRTENSQGLQPVIETSVESRTELNRLNNRVELYFKGSYIESSLGELIAFRGESRLSSQTVKTEVEVNPGELVIRTMLGDKADTRTVSFAGKIAGPEGLRLISLQSLKGNGDTVSFQMYSAEMTRIVRGTRTVTGRETLAGPNGEIDCLKVLDTYENLPVKRTLWLDSDGFEVKTSDPSPFGEITARFAEKSEASILASAALPDEVYERTLGLSNIRLPQARLLESVTIKITHKKPELGWPALEGEYQHVLEKGADVLVLRIDRPSLPDSEKTAADMSDYLKSNVYLDAEDPLVQRTAKEIVAKEQDTYRKAILLKNWVSRKMNFDLGITLAPSSEVMRNLRGTCAAYASLLASLARAAGIPSRYLMGYVYLNGIWGGHAWTEAYVNGAWIPLDAAVNGPGIADAARFYFSRTTLHEGPGEATLGGQQLYGNIDIKIVEYKLSGKTHSVEDDSPLYVIQGNRYSNAGLGIHISKPEAFTFSDTDKVWPERVLVRMNGPEGETVNLLQDKWQPGQDPEGLANFLLDGIIEEGVYGSDKLLGRKVYKKIGHDEAAAALLNGVDAFIIHVEGKEAGTLLGKVLPTLSVDVLIDIPRTE